MKSGFLQFLNKTERTVLAAFVWTFLLQMNQRIRLQGNTRASPNAVNASNCVLTGLQDLEINNAMRWGGEGVGKDGIMMPAEKWQKVVEQNSE